MKFTLDWLYQYIDDKGLGPQAMADRLTMLGLEVDSITSLSEGIEDIIVARVEQTRKHPNADRLTLCEVNTGVGETVQVVCGAPNVRAGLVTAMAKPGVTMPGGMSIQKAKVRGELSAGMLCSAKELGLSKDHSGIMELNADLVPGVLLVDALGLRDQVIEVDLTPNRSDCASVIGIARELAAVTGQSVRHPVLALPVLDGTGLEYSIRIEEPDLCPRYAAKRLCNVTVKESPAWLRRRLQSVGMRPINNVVDITNFVMLEYGQPLHAFDYKKINGKEIVIRCPLPEEKEFVTLDSALRTLDAKMLMICDASGPVAVAGVMGGLNSEVDGATTEVLLEAACFNPVSIRRTAKLLNLPSEASYRFERGVDPDGVTRAMERAVQLMVELAGATADTSGIDLYPGRKEPVLLQLRVHRANELIGVSLSTEEIISRLQSIECGVTLMEQGLLKVRVPSFRVDITREVDLIEEIARLIGYDNIPVSMPSVAMDYPSPDPLRTLRRRLSEIMTTLGFTEAINYSFTSAKFYDFLGLGPDDARRKTVTLLNPISADQAVLRTTLLPGLLENVRHNLNFQQSDIRLFEIGKVFFPDENPQPVERHFLGAVLSGLRQPGAPALFNTEHTDILDVKGVAEAALNRLGLQAQSGAFLLIPAVLDTEAYLDSDSMLTIMDGAERVGLIGKISDTTALRFSIKQAVYFLELNLWALNQKNRSEIKFKSLPRYPAVHRDISLLVPQSTPAGALLHTIHATDNALVEAADIFDVYAGEPIEQGMKSVALSVTYRSATQTLADEMVDAVHEKIVQSLMSACGGRYREG